MIENCYVLKGQYLHNEDWYIIAVFKNELAAIIQGRLKQNRNEIKAYIVEEYDLH